MTVLEPIEARKICGSLRRNQGKVEGQAVLHEGHLHALDDCTLVLEHLDGELLDVPVSFVKLRNVELVNNTDAETLKTTWSVNISVSDAFDVSDLVHLGKVEAVRVMLVSTLHDVYNLHTKLQYMHAESLKERTLLTDKYTYRRMRGRH